MARKSERLKPLSLYPLTPEKALSAFMRVKPKKLKTQEHQATLKKKPPRDKKAQT